MRQLWKGLIARKKFFFKKKSICNYLFYPTTLLSSVMHSKLLTHWYKLVIASYTLDAILCKRGPCGKISLTLIYSVDVWVVSSCCNQNTQWKRDYSIKRQSYRHILPTNSRLLQTYGFPPNMAVKDVTFVKHEMVVYVTELVCVPFI